MTLFDTDMDRACFYLSTNAQMLSQTHNADPGATLTVRSAGKDGTVSTWSLCGGGLTAIEDRRLFDEGRVISQTVRVVNKSLDNVDVECVSAVCVRDIGTRRDAEPADDCVPLWYQDYQGHPRFWVYYADFAWQGEAQWHKCSLRDLGVYPTYNHSHMTAFKMSGRGSWTTENRYPCVILEDTANNKTHFFEIEARDNWYIEISANGYQDRSGLTVMMSDCCFENHGWHVILSPEKSVTTCPGVYGCVEGGFENAVAALNRYKRMTNAALFTTPDGLPPVCFNDYMNCLWAQPSDERLRPLIQAAASAGCEVFCIDAGWFGLGDWYIHNGDWEPADSRFGSQGLSGVIQYVREQGMTPGLWLELETAHTESDFARKHPMALLTRNHNLLGGDNGFLDYRQNIVRTHVHGIIDRLYRMGVRYIKNDYNHSTGPAVDGLDGTASAQALREHSASFLSFIDGISAEYPDLMIENCGSGAMRCSHGVLSHFHLQSTSDQEYYDRYPSIIQGMGCLMPPEKAGIWAYPYPVDFHLRERYCEVYPGPDAAFLDSFANGRQTSFNMVNGMMGLLYLSGRICYADEFNRKLIKDAVSAYKKNRPVLVGASPVYPDGFLPLDGDGFTCYGLLNEKEKTLLLAVWRIRSSKTGYTVDLSRYARAVGSNAMTVKDEYPSIPGYLVTKDGLHLTVSFPDDTENSAVWVKVVFSE